MEVKNIASHNKLSKCALLPMMHASHQRHMESRKHYNWPYLLSHPENITLATAIPVPKLSGFLPVAIFKFSGVRDTPFIGYLSHCRDS